MLGNEIAYKKSWQYDSADPLINIFIDKIFTIDCVSEAISPY